MALELLVPLSTEVIEHNPECVTGGAYRDGALVIDLHALQQEHWQKLVVPQETPMHWGPTYTVEVQELASITASATFGHSASPDNVTCWYIMALQ